MSTITPPKPEEVNHSADTPPPISEKNNNVPEEKVQRNTRTKEPYGKNEIKTKRKHKNKHKKKFGRLVNRITLSLHTRDALFVYWGNWGKEAVSLLKFANQMARVWQGARLDDPYADACLFKVYRALLRQQETLSKQIENYAGQLEAPLEPFVSDDPFVSEVKFNTPYGFMGVRLLDSFDRLARIFLTARRTGIPFGQDYVAIRSKNLLLFKKHFTLPFTWRSTGIARADVIKKTPLYERVRQKFGELPEGILHRDTCVPFAPPKDD